MASLTTDADEVIRTIQNNLADRYKDVFAVLKELIQNADDAGSKSLVVDLHDGFVDAQNPLLRVPGLLVCNDGRYEAANAASMLRASRSTKAAETGSAGRFGLGQKALFHLCDAFLVVPSGYGEELRPFVTNPFLDLQSTRVVTEAWDEVSNADADRLRSALDRVVFTGPVLALWLPLRRRDLLPAPGLCFTTKIFDDHISCDELVGHLDRRPALAGILAAARSLDRIDLRRGSASVTSLERRGGHMRLVSRSGDQTVQRDKVQLFSGAVSIATTAGMESVRFSGYEVLSADPRLVEVRNSGDWPSPPDLMHQPRPEKALAHGACVLARGATFEAGVSIADGVFLPLGDGAGEPISAATPLRLSLFLHGYYFVDPGRRGIIGFSDGAAAHDTVKERWNRELRDRVVLPAVPRLLLRALDDGMLAPTDLTGLVRALRGSTWFGAHGPSICRGGSLAEVWVHGGLRWSFLPPAARLRPLPASLLGSPDRLADLLPDLEGFARDRGLTICAADDEDTSRVLAERAPVWEAVELTALVAGVPAAGLRQRRTAEDFAALLAVARGNDPPDAAIGRALRAKLREVLRADAANQAAHETMRDVIRHVPRGAVVFLPEAAIHSEILAALAAAAIDSSVKDALVVDARWKPLRGGKPDDAEWRLEEAEALAPLLTALEPFVVQERGLVRADQAARAAVAIAEASRAGLPSLARDPALRAIKLFPVTRQPGGDRRVLSMEDLRTAAKDGTLVLSTSFGTRQNMSLLLAALPDLSLLLVGNSESDPSKKAMQDETWSGDLGIAAVVGFVVRAMNFSDDAKARGALLDKFGKLETGDAIQAARRLVAGVAEAGAPGVTLYADVPSALAPLVGRMLQPSPHHRTSAFLADKAALDQIDPRKHAALGLTSMRGVDIENLLRRSLASGSFDCSQTEGEALLSCALLGDERFDVLLHDLPIHALEDGGLAAIGKAEVMRPDRPRPVPPALAGLMRRVVPAADEGARARQGKLLPSHDAEAEIHAATRAPGDHVGLRDVILDALAEVDAGALPADLLGRLREKTWLSTHGHHVAPSDVLALPEAVGNAARAALKGDAGPSLHLVEDLPEAVRRHRGFARHRGSLLPDAGASFARLAEMIEKERPVGLPVAWDEGRRGNLAALARMDLGLPAWRLAAALLGVCGSGATDCLAALAPARSADELGCALNTLAEAASWPAVAEAGHDLYRAAFKQGVPDLDAVDRRRLFSAIAVPTAAGKWKRGSEVASRGDGLAPSCVLEYGLAEVLIEDEEPIPGEASAPSPRSSPDTAVQDVDARSAEGFRSLLEGVRGRIEADLALTLLGIAGRFPAMRDAMAYWQGTHGDAAKHLAAMDEESKIGCGPRHMETQNTERRFLLEQTLGADVPAIALSGIRFDARKGDATSLVIGNIHEEGVRQGAHLVHTLQIQPSALAGLSVKETTERLRGLARTVMGCWPRASDSLRSAEHFPGMRGEPSQAVLEETQAALREDLPALLKLLKTRQRPALRALVDDNVKASERRLSPGSASPGDDRAAAERRLWDGLKADERAQAQLLDCVRESLKNFGYDPVRVVFELYQNADDATLQRDAGGGPLAFRLSGGSDRFDVVHWGRPINDRGRDRASGENHNYHRDLRNMLMLHASEKDGADTTGKYGIGFKSVHLLSRDVRIASGLLATRIAGGILPFEWNAGPDEVTTLYRDGRPATLIRVIYDDGQAQQGGKAVECFAKCAPYLPLFARRIRRVEVDGTDHTRGEDRSVPGMVDAHVATLRGSSGFESLVLRLDEEFTLAMKLGGAGPEPFPPGAPRLWWTAPLDVRLDAGWMLNGPFTLSANRVALADGAEAREERFKNLGVALGRQLLALYRAAAAGWDDFRDALDLDRDATLQLFCARLWDLFRRDLGDEIAGMLHGPGRGLGPLSAEAPLVPAGRGGGNRIRAGEVAGVVAGAMCDRAIRDAMAHWDSAAMLADRVVNGATAVDLEHLGHPQAPVSAASLLRRELDAERCRVSPEMAARLGDIFHLTGTYRAPLETEGQAIREAAAGALFRDRSGAWRTALGLVVPRQNDDADDLRAAFAPDDAVLADDYEPKASAFVLLARAQAGYPPSHQTMLDWARRAATVGARTAALRYLITQNQWGPFASEFRSNAPGWAEPLDVLAHSPFTAGWTAESLNRLRAVLHDCISPNVSPPADAPPAAEPDLSDPARSPTDTLEAIWRWWDQERDAAIDRYEGGLYPAGFRPADLTRSNNRLDVADREGWFSFLALACFSGFGGAQDGQHRTFIDGQGHDWWRELAQAVPERDDHVWLARLKSWSGAEQADLSHWRWRRTLVDLYKIARWLPQYAWMFSVLPGAVRQAGAISLNDLLTPSFSRAWQDAGLEAAPLPRSLGLGANWAIRELLRARFWTGDEAYIMAPYAFASTRRARSLLNRLGADLGEEADMDLSRPMWNFVAGHIPHRCADLLRDGDLPLQIYALKRGDSLEPDVRPPDLPLDHGGGSVDEDEDGDGLFRDAAE